MAALEVEKELRSNIGADKSDEATPSGGQQEETVKVDEQARLWRTVRENPSDFTSWTSLLQIVEQKVPLMSCREFNRGWCGKIPFILS